MPRPTPELRYSGLDIADSHACHGSRKHDAIADAKMNAASSSYNARFVQSCLQHYQ